MLADVQYLTVLLSFKMTNFVMTRIRYFFGTETRTYVDVRKWNMDKICKFVQKIVKVIIQIFKYLL